jgi:hypothetical protein
MRAVKLLDERFDPSDGIALAGYLAKGDPADWERWEHSPERGGAGVPSSERDAAS